jgi:hypothetical protein
MNTTDITKTRTVARRWPLLLLAAPAAVSIWAGWVGLGTMAGFGLVHPLPGIADSFELNSAITLPIGVEAYSAYALGTWLTGRPMPATARRFAGWSSLIALVLGLVGQVVYHVLATTGHVTAPVAVVVFVACLPVLVLGAGATLHHLLGDDTGQGSTLVEPVATTEPTVTEPSLATPPTPPLAQRSTKRKRKPAPRQLKADYLTVARAALTPDVDPSPAWCQRVSGCSKGLSSDLAKILRAERGPALVADLRETENGEEAA